MMSFAPNSLVLVVSLALVTSVGCVDTHPVDTFDDLLAATPPTPSVPAAPMSPTPSHERPPDQDCPREPLDPTAPRTLTRELLRGVVARGFGSFLSRVRVSPVLAHGRFVGFRLDCATDLLLWQSAGADLRVGDVITRVNNRSVELPDVAFAVFQSLPDAAELTVDILRDGNPLTLRRTIAPDVSVTAAPVR